VSNLAALSFLFLAGRQDCGVKKNDVDTGTLLRTHCTQPPNFIFYFFIFSLFFNPTGRQDCGVRSEHRHAGARVARSRLPEREHARSLQDPRAPRSYSSYSS
jgi:hypothetical protein